MGHYFPVYRGQVNSFRNCVNRRASSTPPPPSTPPLTGGVNVWLVVLCFIFIAHWHALSAGSDSRRIPFRFRSGQSPKKVFTGFRSLDIPPGSRILPIDVKRRPFKALSRLKVCSLYSAFFLFLFTTFFTRCRHPFHNII